MKILIAEDDPVAMEALTGLLAKWGHEVVTAHDGQEAERLLLAADAPAVAILDWVMPKQSGLDVCRALRARGTDSPYVILITANHERHHIQTAFDAGVDDFIAKPVDPPELRARLKAAERIVTLQGRLHERANRAESDLQTTQERIQSFFENAPLMMGVVEITESDIKHLTDNATTNRLASELGLSKSAIDTWLIHYRECARTGIPVTFEYLHGEGTGARWLRATVSPLRTAAADTPQFSYVAADITERKKGEILLQRTNRALNALNLCQTALMHVKDEGQLLDDICRIVVERAGYQMAWIGYMEHDEARTVRPAARAGVEEGYIATLNMTWADTERGQGPTGTAIRTACPVICRDICTDPHFAPWREEAVKRGYGSSVGLPMIAGGSVIGALSVYAAEPDAFGEQEVALLGEIANNLAFAIDALGARAEQQQAEGSLRKSEARFRLVTETVQDVFWMSDPSIDSILYVSPAYEKLWGRTCASLYESPKSFLDPVHPEDRERLLRLYQDNHVQGREYDCEYRLVTADGSIRWVRERGFPVCDEHGKPHLMTGVSSDITKQKEADAAIRRAKLEWERTFDAVPDLIALIDTNHQIIRVNRAMAERLGKTFQEVVGCHCYEAVHGLSAPPDFCPHSKLLASGQEEHAEVAEERLHGVFDVSATPLCDETGKLVGCVHVARDITERRRTEEEIRALNANLERRVQERTAALQEAHESLQRRTAELETFNQAMVGREQRIIEMKGEVNALCQELGREPEYPPVWRKQP